jgi:hypothetical protein
VDVAAEWLLDNGSQSIQHRVIKNFLNASDHPKHLEALSFTAPMGRLAVSQRPDGLWGGGILTHPMGRSRVDEIGAVPAVHRFMEMGWDRESPPLHNARRPLFRLLAEDADPGFLYELVSAGRESDTVVWTRRVLRGAAASALSRAGYERDPRLRGAAMRLITRVDEFLLSPVAENPWIKHAGAVVLSPDASPPSHHLLIMLAFMPEFRNEHEDFADRLLAWLSRPLPRHPASQLVGGRVLSSPYLLLGDPLTSRQSADGDVPFALYWLEMMARLGLLDRHDGWKRLFERFLDDRDRDFVWRPSRGHTMASDQEIVWPFADLQGSGAAGGAVDATFRLALIARCAGRTISLV